MSCRLIQNIKHGCEYNAGGITNIYIMDIDDFLYYLFKGDKLYNQCFVNDIIVTKEGELTAISKFVELDTVNESNFTETQDNGIYKQQLSTFIRTPEATKSANLLLAGVNKYLIAFRTSQDRYYCFGSDGGASLSYSQISGQTGEVSGYTITISKESIYPCFETDKAVFRNIIRLLSHEDGLYTVTEDNYSINI